MSSKQEAERNKNYPLLHSEPIILKNFLTNEKKQHSVKYDLTLTTRKTSDKKSEEKLIKYKCIK